MGLWATRDGNGRVKVCATSGPVTVSVLEELPATRHFWGQLGRLLDETEQAGRTPQNTDERDD